MSPRTIKTKNGRAVVLRCAEPNDAAALLAFADHNDRTSEYLLTQPGERQMTVEQEREWLQKTLDHALSINILAVEAGEGNNVGGRFVGFLNFKGNERRRVAHWGVLGIAVHAEWRSQGIGAALMQALLDWASAHPIIEKVCLDVFEPNHHARALYAKMGFKEEWREERGAKLEDGTYVNGVRMSIWVKNV